LLEEELEVGLREGRGEGGESGSLALDCSSWKRETGMHYVKTLGDMGCWKMLKMGWDETSRSHGPQRLDSCHHKGQ
jgi:hypothetical protein